jgi:hypothetical protein
METKTPKLQANAGGKEKVDELKEVSSDSRVAPHLLAFIHIVFAASVYFLRMLWSKLLTLNSKN